MTAVVRDELPTEYLASVRHDEYEELARRRGLRGETSRVIETGATAGVLSLWLLDRGIRSMPMEGGPPARFVPEAVEAPEGAPSWLAAV